MQTIDSVGVIGVGTMGSHIVEWLLEAEYTVYAYDIDEGRIEAAEAMGANGTDDAAEVSAQATVILLSLPGSEYVIDAMDGSRGVLNGMGADQVLIDTGTTRIETDLYYQQRCAEAGSDLLDAPVTWGGPGDRLTMFVGGDASTYERVTPVLDAITSQHHRFGELGAGQIVKAGHRLRQNNQAMVDAEMVEFLRNNGVDPADADDLLELGLHSRLFEEDYPSTVGWDRGRVEGDGEPAGVSFIDSGDRPRMDVSHWAKDQAYAVEIGHASNTALPISTAVYHAMLMSENYATALFDRPLRFQDPDWFDRADPVSHFRRLNRPAEEWDRVNQQGSENT